MNSPLSFKLMKLNWSALSFVAFLRNQSITAKKCADLREIIGNITPAEKVELDKWDSYIKNTIDIYPEYSTSESPVYLGIKTGFRSPLEPTSSVLSKVHGNKQLLAFYTYCGYNVNYPKPQFTPEQKLAII